MSTHSHSEHDQPHPQRLIVAITGATGAIYGVRLLQTLRQLPQIETHLIVSEAGWLTIAHELEMSKDEIRALEEQYAKHECPVVSNNSANRFTPDVPMVVPELNPQHIDIIPAQRKRLGTKRGFIAVKSNCSLQSYVPALHPLMKEFGVNKALVCTYQAISGAGKTFDRMPEIVDNIIPYIGGEEE